MRTTCLYCEREGRETPLIHVGHWGFCPIHSAAHLAALGIKPPPKPGGTT